MVLLLVWLFGSICKGDHCDYLECNGALTVIKSFVLVSPSFVSAKNLTKQFQQSTSPAFPQVLFSLWKIRSGITHLDKTLSWITRVVLSSALLPSISIIVAAALNRTYSADPSSVSVDAQLSLGNSYPRGNLGPEPPFTTNTGSILHHYHGKSIRAQPHAYDKLQTGYERAVQVSRPRQNIAFSVPVVRPTNPRWLKRPNHSIHSSRGECGLLESTKYITNSVFTWSRAYSQMRLRSVQGSTNTHPKYAVQQAV